MRHDILPAVVSTFLPSTFATRAILDKAGKLCVEPPHLLYAAVVPFSRPIYGVNVQPTYLRDIDIPWISRHVGVGDDECVLIHKPGLTRHR